MMNHRGASVHWLHEVTLVPAVRNYVQILVF